jgi:hypothetical protein
MRTHRAYRKLLPLYLYEELSGPDKRAIEDHLVSCAECRSELDETRKLLAVVSRQVQPEVSETFLDEARRQARYALAQERTRRHPLIRVKEFFMLPVVYRPAVALSACALLVAGYFLAQLRTPAAFSSADRYAAEEVRVTNVRTMVTGNGDEVDLAFEAVRPVRLRGRLDDPAIQRVLARALLSGENPGVRLRAVGAISASNQAAPEREVKAALILALESDQNDGVRKEALQALLRYTPDREIRDVLLNVLLHDRNPGLRIAAINGLDSLHARGFRSEVPLPAGVQQQLQNDNNLYVRVKAKSIYGEITP